MFLLFIFITDTGTSLMAQMVKNLPAMQDSGFNPWVGKSPWRRKWPPTPVFLPGEFHGQGSLAGYSPWGLKESYRTELITHITDIYIALRLILPFYFDFSYSVLFRSFPPLLSFLSCFPMDKANFLLIFQKLYLLNLKNIVIALT